MKKFYLTALVACFALAGNAQKITFEKNSIVSLPQNEDGTVNDTKDNLYSTHRAVPLWGDFDNNGFMDVYYAGTSCVHGWQTTACLAWNQGGGIFKNDFERVWEEYTYTEVDEDGNETEKTGVRENGVVNGLPKTSFGMGSVTLDYDQDGLLDFLFLNRGGNDTGTERELVLVHNRGNHMFEKVNDPVLYDAGFWHDNNDSFNEDQETGTLSIGDYDKDGYPDILVEGAGYAGRFVRLFHNNAGKGFELVHPVKPIALADEINPLGLYEKGEDVYDEDGIKIEDGAITDVPTGDFKPMSHGNVSFADFDNDGWLDIIASGYMDGNDLYNGGDGIRFYRNLGDGSFQDITNKVAEACGTDFLGLQQRWGHEDCGLSVMDFNQDGKQDMLLIGSIRDRGPKQAIVLQNVTDGDVFAFEEVSTGILPTSGVTVRLFTVADFNGDDYADVMLRGWTSYEDWNDWRYSINYTNYSNNYEFDAFNTNDPEDIGGHFCETMSFGDFNGDGLLDAATTEWGANMDYTAIHYNTTDAQITAPDAPTNVQVEVSEDGVLNVTWDQMTLPISGNEPLYNIYFKDNATGKTFVRVPANLETGMQLGYARWSEYLLGGGETPSFSIALPDGDYTVGVQTVSYNYAASAFTTTEAKVAVGISNPTAVPTSAPKYFTLDGRRANANTTGIVVVRNGNEVKKIVR